MQQHNILHKRNIFIYFTFIFLYVLYHFMLFAGFFENVHLTYSIVTLLELVAITLLLYRKANEYVIQFSLLLSWNISTIIIIIESQNIITFHWLVMLILLSNIYRSILLSIYITMVLSIEAALLYYFHIKEIAANIEQNSSIYIFFFMLLILSGIFQTIYIQRFWKKAEQTNLQREQVLSSTEAYLKLFFESASDAIAVFDLNNKVIEVNPAFEKLYGWKREESIGKSLPLVPIENIDEANERIGKLLRGEQIHLIETKDMRKDGTLVDVQISLSPIYNQYGEMIATSVISRDISYKKENERLLLQSEKLRLAGEIAAGVAHEIRNPLTAISGFVQMMNADENSPYKLYTPIIQSEIERINLIISEFLILSRPQLQTFESINMEIIVEEIAKFFTYELESKNIQLIKKINAYPAYINGNANQIKQVLINLLKNAIEAIQHNGEIQIELSIKQNKVEISVIDDGVGIPPHVLNRIFEPFYTTKTKGTGLGMMITQKIIQEHSGSIVINSKENIGTEITISFPLHDPTV